MVPRVLSFHSIIRKYRGYVPVRTAGIRKAAYGITTVVKPVFPGGALFLFFSYIGFPNGPN